MSRGATHENAARGMVSEANSPGDPAEKPKHPRCPRKPRSRPRGWMSSWRPRPHTIKLLDQIQLVLDEYREQLPLSLRQVFYRLVGAYGYPKDEKAYKRLTEAANKARRARVLSMDAIRDDGNVRLNPDGWQSRQALINAWRYSVETFRIDRQQGQDRRLFLWCEATGMAPQLADLAQPYGVPVLSGGGFDSLTLKHALACELAELGEVEVLHIGDHDPSGWHLFKALEADIQGLAEAEPGAITFTGLAVTPEQIATYDLPTSEAKETDGRSFDGPTAQAEALPPDMLARIVESAILDRIDHVQRAEVIAAEHEHRAELRQLLARLA